MFTILVAGVTCGTFAGSFLGLAAWSEWSSWRTRRSLDKSLALIRAARGE